MKTAINITQNKIRKVEAYANQLYALTTSNKEDGCSQSHYGSALLGLCSAIFRLGLHVTYINGCITIVEATKPTRDLRR